MKVIQHPRCRNEQIQYVSARDTNVSNSARNNRFLVLRNQEKQAIAFDLQERKKVDLPAELRQSATKDILDWLKK